MEITFLGNSLNTPVFNILFGIIVLSICIVTFKVFVLSAKYLYNFDYIGFINRFEPEYSYRNTKDYKYIQELKKEFKI